MPDIYEIEKDGEIYEVEASSETEALAALDEFQPAKTVAPDTVFTKPAAQSLLEGAVGFGKQAIDTVKGLGSMVKTGPGGIAPSIDIVPMLESATQARYDAWNKGTQALDEGRYVEGLGYKAAGLIPFLGPMAASIGENLGSADPERMGRAGFDIAAAAAGTTPGRAAVPAILDTARTTTAPLRRAPGAIARNAATWGVAKTTGIPKTVLDLGIQAMRSSPDIPITEVAPGIPASQLPKVRPPGRGKLRSYGEEEPSPRTGPGVPTSEHKKVRSPAQRERTIDEEVGERPQPSEPVRREVEKQLGEEAKAAQPTPEDWRGDYTSTKARERKYLGEERTLSLPELEDAYRNAVRSGDEARIAYFEKRLRQRSHITIDEIKRRVREEMKGTP